MRKIKINYVDWWDGFNPKKYLINDILKKYYDIEISNEPDYIFCSVYSQNYRLYDCIRIFYTGENMSADFNSFDYAIGFDEMSFGDRYIRVPNYLMNPKYQLDVERMLNKHNECVEGVKTEFCSFVCSNGKGDQIREDFLDCLSKYKKVNSGGRFRNNIGIQEGVPDKWEFQHKHKFSMAFENSSHKGYTTEKIVQSFAAGTIPIYWGDPDIKKYFNENSFVNVSDYNSLEDAVEKVKYIDSHEDIYMSMLKTPALNQENIIEDTYLQLEQFLLNIFEQPLHEAKRRTTSIWGEYSMYNGNAVSTKCKTKKRLWFS